MLTFSRLLVKKTKKNSDLKKEVFWDDRGENKSNEHKKGRIAGKHVQWPFIILPPICQDFNKKLDIQPRRFQS